MVDPISARPIGTERSVGTGPVARVAPTRSAAAVTSNEAAAPRGSNPLSELVAASAATPPVDLERVERIRHAIANNNYPITPETIADRLLALKLNWNANDPS